MARSPKVPMICAGSTPMSMSVSAWKAPVTIFGFVACQTCVLPSPSVYVAVCGGGGGDTWEHTPSTSS